MAYAAEDSVQYILNKSHTSENLHYGMYGNGRVCKIDSCLRVYRGDVPIYFFTIFQFRFATADLSYILSLSQTSLFTC